jgi:hypothetical protein
MWSQTIKTLKEWEERGATTTRTTSKQRIGGAILKKGQPERLTAD